MSCPWESSRRPCSSNPIFVQLVRSSTNLIQTANSHHNNCHNGDRSKADETGASVAPGQKHHSRVRVYGANVLWNSLTKKNKKQLPLLTSSSESSHCYAVWQSKHKCIDIRCYLLQHTPAVQHYNVLAMLLIMTATRSTNSWTAEQRMAQLKLC